MSHFSTLKNEKKDKLNLIEPVLNIIYYTVLLNKICEDNIIIVSISEGDRIETRFLTQYLPVVYLSSWNFTKDLIVQHSFELF